MDPYRIASDMSNNGKEFGLILALPKHECKTPGVWFHLRMFLSGKHICEGSLWRCSCGSVFYYGWGVFWFGTWLPKVRGAKSWEEMGGYISPQFRIENKDTEDDPDELDEDDDWDEDLDDEEGEEELGY